MRVLELDGIIFGGGVAGLWILDELRRHGLDALLVERNALGAGQTICAQGILHSGLKYTLQGMVTPAAREARKMPEVWREALDGRGELDLSGVKIRSPHCYLWRTNDLSSRLGMFGAHIGLKVTPETVDAQDRPAVFRGCPGPVSRVAEPVIDTGELLRVLNERNCRSIVKADEVSFKRSTTGQVRTVRLRSEGKEIEVRSRNVILAAGGGNAGLREACGLASEAMQRRPLQMVMVRGDLPECFGHCVDGAKTRVTITSARDTSGRVVWQLGGQVAELGVNSSPSDAIRFAREELTAVLPGVSFENTEWGSYRIDRAEERMRAGGRPDSVSILEEGNVLTVWPTKMVLAPMLARRVKEIIIQQSGGSKQSERQSSMVEEAFQRWERPTVALPPWERLMAWTADRDVCLEGVQSRTGSQRRAA